MSVTATFTGKASRFRIRQTDTVLKRDVPTVITDGEAAILAAREDVAVTLDYGRTRPEHITDKADSVTPEPPGDRDEEPPPEIPKPQQSDTKDQWLEYARSIGVEYADALTKAELMAACRDIQRQANNE